VHVGQDARKDEQRAGDGKNPSEDASAAPEKQANAEKHRQKSDAEGVSSPEVPVRTHHRNLVDQQVSADTGHDEAQCKMAEAAGRSAHIAESTVFHGRKYTRGAAGQTFLHPARDEAHIAIGNYGRETNTNLST